MAHMDMLPIEIIGFVLSFLDLAQQLRLAAVSRRWRQAVEDCLGCRRHLGTADVPGRVTLTNQTLQKLLSRLPALRRLRARGYRLDADIVSRHCPHLVELDLVGFRVTKPTLQRLCARCPRIEVVTLPGRCSEACAEVVLRRPPLLRSLGLAHTKVTGRCLSLLPASLQWLSVRHCHSLQSAHLRHVARCTGLTELDFTGLQGLQAADLAPLLAACTRLERLTASNPGPPLERCLPPAGLPALRHLHVERSSWVTDTTLEQLPRLLPGLHTLNISYCWEVTEASLSCLARLGQLRALSLSGLRCVTDGVLDQLHGSALSKLQLGSDGDDWFTPAGLSRLVMACPSLKSLGLDNSDTDRVKTVIDNLVRQLTPDRDFTLTLYDTVLAGVPPPPPGPLRLARFPFLL